MCVCIYIYIYYIYTHIYIYYWVYKCRQVGEGMWCANISYKKIQHKNKKSADHMEIARDGVCERLIQIESVFR